MSDVEIIFPNSKAPLAERLREAIAHAGYDVAPGGGVAPDETPPTPEAPAVLILWDRSSIKQPGLQQAAAAARHRGRAIDVSADGITPADLADETRLIHLSAWRGDSLHPGWRKILAELERLGGGRRSAAVPARPAPARATPGAPADTAAARPASRARLAAICATILLVLVLAGYFTLSRRSLNLDGTPQETRPAMAAAQPMAAPTSGTAIPARAPAAPAEGAVQTSAATADGGAAAVAEPRPVAAQPVPASLVPAAVSVQARRPSRAARAQVVRERLPGVVRYTRYARTMRLFCQRSGRRTPQCRMFNQAIAAATHGR